MGWLKVDDNAPLHRKHLVAGPAANWLWLCGLAYCQRHASDGFIPGHALRFLGVDAGLKPASLASRLVQAGLWHATDGGFQVHDYLQWNESAAERRSKNDQKQARQRRWRHQGDASTRTEGDASTSRHGGTAPSPPPSPTPTPREIPRASRVSPLVRPRDLHAFYEGPLFNVPQQWVAKLVAGGNRTISETDVQRFANETTAAMQTTGESVDDTVHLFAWLDGKWREWRKSKAVVAVDAGYDRDYAESEARRRSLEARQ